VTVAAAHRAVEAVVRIESPRLIARLSRMLKDVGAAEELAQEALLDALEAWPVSGVPDKPGAWLMAAAKHRALNALRRGKMVQRKHEELGYELDERARVERAVSEQEEALEDFGDDLLRLVFTACHPVLPTEARVALTLRLLGGLGTAEIARAFLLPEPTMAQRLVRAKKTLAEKRVPFEVPTGPELAPRLRSVLEVVYLIFNEGYSASAGDDPMRPDLCEDALRLGHVLAEIAPLEPEVHGLVALMELNASRAAARSDEAGEPVLLLEQDRTRWDALGIRRGLDALARAEALSPERGPYVLQAGITACHARASTPDATDWPQIAALYGELLAQLPSPVIALNRAMAVSMAEGPEAGLKLLDELAGERALERYHLYPSARADLLYKLGRFAEARAEFERAASLTENSVQRERLLARAARCVRAGG
jgi:RNA polymerase sigma-70 factor (ECF subfamily)